MEAEPLHLGGDVWACEGEKWNESKMTPGFDGSKRVSGGEAWKENRELGAETIVHWFGTESRINI